MGDIVKYKKCMKKVCAESIIYHLTSSLAAHMRSHLCHIWRGCCPGSLTIAMQLGSGYSAHPHLREAAETEHPLSIFERHIQLSYHLSFAIRIRGEDHLINSSVQSSSVVDRLDVSSARNSIRAKYRRLYLKSSSHNTDSNSEY